MIGAAVAEGLAPLAGFSVAVTAASRRHRELTTCLGQRGAVVLETPLVRLVPVGNDPALRRLTVRCIEEPPHVLVATTAGGWRRWLDTADKWNLRRPLVAAMSDATVVARGERAAQAVRDDGMAVSWVAASGTLAELLTWLAQRDLANRRVVMQEHGGALDRLAADLSRMGAELIRVAAERWAPQADTSPVRRLATLVARREVHAVTFVNAAAVSTLLDATSRAGGLDDLLAAFASDVAVVCTDQTVAEPLAGYGLPVGCPPEPTPPAVGDLLCTVLGRRGSRHIMARGRPVLLRGHAVFANGSLVDLAPDLAALLRALARRPGESVRRADLARAAWPYGHVTGRTVDRRIVRLQAALGPLSWLVEAVPRYGYRLAASPQPPSD